MQQKYSEWLGGGQGSSLSVQRQGCSCCRAEMQCSPQRPQCREASCNLDSQGPSEPWTPGAGPVALQAALCSLSRMCYLSMPVRIPGSSLALMSVTCPLLLGISEVPTHFPAHCPSWDSSSAAPLPWGHCEHLGVCRFCLSPGPVECSFRLLLVPCLKGAEDTFRAERPPRSHLAQLQRLHL